MTVKTTLRHHLPVWCLARMLHMLRKLFRRRDRAGSLMELSDYLLRDIGYEPLRGRYSVDDRTRHDRL